MQRIRKATQPGLVDLHVHSSASDGALRPDDLVRHAAEVGLKAIALTDHDTVAGVAEAQAAGAEVGVEVIAGVEIGTEFEGGACHILGYFVDPAEPGLADLLTEAREGRCIRNRQILEKLNALGFRMAMQDVIRADPEAVLTRAHFATAMVAAGYVKDFDEAFDKYLGAGKPAYVHRRHIGPAEAIEAIHKAGGLAVAGASAATGLRHGRDGRVDREVRRAGPRRRRDRQPRSHVQPGPAVPRGRPEVRTCWRPAAPTGTARPTAASTWAWAAGPWPSRTNLSRR